LPFCVDVNFVLYVLARSGLLHGLLDIIRPKGLFVWAAAERQVAGAGRVSEAAGADQLVKYKMVFGNLLLGRLVDK
jgi:hypothetical protein